MGRIGLDRQIDEAVSRHAGRQRVVLAVSGGRDSMTLLHAAASVLSPASVMVATFDHGTGAHAERAAAHVARVAAGLGFQVVLGRASDNPGTEAGWRALRQDFLRSVAEVFDGRVMTAHTLDDQVETVLIRVLRGAGARGLAGLYAGAILRPLLGFSREDVADYARRAGIAWVEDPTNASPDFLRNRVRRDLRPALHEVAPGLDEALLAASRAASEVRDRLDDWVTRHADVARGGTRVLLRAADVRERNPEELALVWPAVAARVGLAMDWRGTARAVAFTRTGKVGGQIPLTGGWRITRSREGFELHPAVTTRSSASLESGLDWDGWRFSETTATVVPADAWVAQLSGSRFTVRPWQPADRMRAGGTNRRVKRLLSDAGITGEPRARWPVVLAGDDIVWIPGVGRSDAAAVRPGRPGVRYRCDYDRR